MPGTVLGKRTRSSGPIEEDLFVELPSRSKKQARVSPKSRKEQGGFSIHEDSQNVAVDSQIAESHTAEQRSSPLAPSPSKGNVGVHTSRPDTKPEARQEASVASPKTPRHRDALAKKQFTTPRHRVSVAGLPFTPRTPQTPLSEVHRARTDRSVFAEARKVFARSAQTGPLVGRHKERAEIECFITAAVSTRSGGCLYVSGPPGTGKSALVAEVCDRRDQDAQVKCAYLNCMSVKTAGDVYSHLVSELGLSDDVFGSQAKETLMSAVSAEAGGPSLLVVLDEIDQLLTLDLRILYSLFEWSLDPSSRLILVGIANALDLTDRFLPQLRARNLKPIVIPFLPYGAPEIAAVISARTRSLLSEESAAAADFTPFLTSQAIQLISKKVAAQTGDLRRAFDIAQKIVDLLEGEAREKCTTSLLEQSNSARAPLGENDNLSSPRSPVADDLAAKSSSRSLANFTVETAPRASLAHVLRVTNVAFTANSTVSRLKSLNLQQKAALCSMSALEERNQRKLKMQREESEQAALPSPLSTPSAKRTKLTTLVKPNVSIAAPTIREVHEAYGALCRTENVLHALSSSEFKDVISNLETAGLVSGVDGRGSLVQVAPTTPSRKSRGNSLSTTMGMKVEDCRIKGTASISELESVLEGAGCEVLKRMLQGVNL